MGLDWSTRLANQIQSLHIRNQDLVMCLEYFSGDWTIDIDQLLLILILVGLTLHLKLKLLII